ncbi:hypothetical protein D3C78_1670960 [compost metagenome]
MAISTSLLNSEESIRKSAVERLVATGIFHTVARRSRAFTSGSWGTAFNGSQKKINISILPSAISAPTCWSPPIGPLSMLFTGIPLACWIRLPVVPVA